MIALARWSADQWDDPNGEDDLIAERRLIPDGPWGAVVVFLVWVAATAVIELALTHLASLPSVWAPWVRWSAPLLVFAACLRWVLFAQRREAERYARAREIRRERARERHRAFSHENVYYVLDPLGTRRGPYALEKLVRWRGEGKLREAPVIFVGPSEMPVDFGRVADEWRRTWGESPVDPPELRSRDAAAVASYYI